MPRNQELGDKSHTTVAERQIFNDSLEEFIKMLTELHEEHPNIPLEDMVIQLFGALSEAKAIMLLKEIKKPKNSFIDANKIEQLINK